MQTAEFETEEEKHALDSGFAHASPPNDLLELRPGDCLGNSLFLAASFLPPSLSLYLLDRSREGGERALRYSLLHCS